MGMPKIPESGDVRIRTERLGRVLEVLSTRESITIEELVRLLPGERWSDLFQTVNFLHWEGLITITQQDAHFEISRHVGNPAPDRFARSCKLR